MIQKAITVSCPKTRYPVTLAAHMVLALRRWLPDTMFDPFLRTQFRSSADRTEHVHLSFTTLG